MRDTPTNMPDFAVEHFAEGWFPYSVPESWVEPIRDWTTALDLSYPDFKYHQIKVELGEARVYAEGVPQRILSGMESDLTRALLHG